MIKKNGWILSCIVLMIMIFISGMVTIGNNDEQDYPTEVTVHFGKQGLRELYPNLKDYEFELFAQYIDPRSFLWYGDGVKGTLHMNYGGHILTLNNLFTISLDKLDGGIASIHVEGFLTPEGKKLEQSYQAYVALLTELKKQGWQHYIRPEDARIAKTDNIKLLMSKSVEDRTVDLSSEEILSDSSQLKDKLNDLDVKGCTSDSLQILSYDEWKQLIEEGAGINSYLISKDIILHLTMELESAGENGTLVNVSYKFHKANYQVRYDDYQDRINGINDINELKKFYNDKRAHDLAYRAKQEKIAKEQGFTIDESYQDPDLWQYVIAK